MIQGYDIVVYLCDYNSLIKFVTIQRRFCRFPTYGEHIGKSVTVCEQDTKYYSVFTFGWPVIIIILHHHGWILFLLFPGCDQNQYYSYTAVLGQVRLRTD